MAKRNSATKRKKAEQGNKPFDKPSIDDRDAVLIRLCCSIGADYAAFNGAFQVDPDGNNTHAEKIAYPCLRRAQRNCRKAAEIRAITVFGLFAKARAAEAAMKDDQDSSLEESTEALVNSLLADTARIAEEFAAKEWEAIRSERQAEIHRAAIENAAGYVQHVAKRAAS